jgi:hypothetical protein
MVNLSSVESWDFRVNRLSDLRASTVQTCQKISFSTAVAYSRARRAVACADALQVITRADARLTTLRGGDGYI